MHSLLFALLFALGSASAAAAVKTPVNPELDELSGLAYSLATPDWLWAHNDSGDRARLFRVGFDGRDGGTVEVPEATAIDWEDLAAFRWQGKSALLIGDIGDNAAKRAAVTLYAVADPDAEGKVAALLWQFNFRYPDGPLDAEGLAVDPISGDILILSKREHPPAIYRLPMPASAPKPGSVATAERLGPVLDLPIPTVIDLAEDPLYGSLRDWPTALAIAPDGLSAVVVTYKDAHRYPRLTPDEPWAAVFARTPERIDLPQFKQTEAGSFTADGLRFCAGSEQRAGFVCRPLMPLPHERHSSGASTNP